MGEEVTQLLLDKRSETTEPHCTTGTRTQYHRNHTLPLCRSGRYQVIPQVYCTANKKIPKLYHNVCFILYHMAKRSEGLRLASSPLFEPRADLFIFKLY